MGKKIRIEGNALHYAKGVFRSQTAQNLKKGCNILEQRNKAYKIRLSWQNIAPYSLVLIEQNKA